MKPITKVSNMVVADFTPSNLMVNHALEINASPERIWQTLIDQSIAAQWMPSVKKIESSDTTKADTNGVGIEQIAVYGSGDKIKQTVVYGEKNRVYAYRADFPYMVKDHLSIIEITDNGNGSSTVRLYAFFTPTDFTGYLMKYGVYGAIVKSSLKKLRQLCSP